MANDLAPREAKMLRAYFVLIGGLLTGGFLLARRADVGALGRHEPGSFQLHRSKKSRGRRGLHAGDEQRAAAARADVHRLFQPRHAPTGAPATSTRPSADFTKVLELKPSFARAYEARGMAQDDLGNRDKALADLDEAIKLDAKDWQLFYSRAVVLRADGDTERRATRPRCGRRHQVRCRQCAADARPHPGRQGLLRRGARRDQPRASPPAAATPRRITHAPPSPSTEGRVDAAEDDADRALELDVRLRRRAHAEGAHPRRARRQVGRARALRQGAGRRLDSFDGRTTRRVAKERLSALGGPVKDKRDRDVAEVVLEKKGPIDCKVFLPATRQRRHRKVQRVARA